MIRISRRSFISLPFASNPVHTHKLSKRVGLPPDILFDVVSDVASYKTFIPFVTNSSIYSVDSSTGLPNKAGFEIGWHNYEETMICDVDCTKNRRVFSKATSTLMFDFLQNEWIFDPILDKPSGQSLTRVDLNLQYRFKNPLLNSVSSMFQHQVSKIMIESFLKRAIQMQKKNSRKVN